MKKTILNTLFICVVILLTAGCSARITGYEAGVLDNKLKENLLKNTSVFAEVVFVKQDIREHDFPTNIPGLMRPIGIIIKTDEISSNVTKEFLEQYFTNVSVSNNIDLKKDISISSEIIDYKILRGFDSVMLSHKFTIYKRGKKVFEKNIPFTQYDSTLILSLTHATPDAMVTDFIHFTLLDLLEKEIKPELIKVVNSL